MSRTSLVTVRSNAVHDSGYTLQTVVELDVPEIISLSPPTVVPAKKRMKIKVSKEPQKTGVLMVGWGGNNGTTFTAGLLANRHNLSWETAKGTQTPDFKGSLFMSGTTRLGTLQDDEIFVPLRSLLPMVNPEDLCVWGWDISGQTMAEAMKRSGVLDLDLQKKLAPHMRDMRPWPSFYDPSFIAANQMSRADNLLKGTKKEVLSQIMQQIKWFRTYHSLDKVIVVWTANTERFSGIMPGRNVTGDELLRYIDEDGPEISPSTLFAVASILCECPYINGSPQNTFVPGVMDLARKFRVYLGGDDFKTGQTKLKSALVDYLVGSGIKPLSIVSLSVPTKHVGFPEKIIQVTPYIDVGKGVCRTTGCRLYNSNVHLYNRMVRSWT